MGQRGGLFSYLLVVSVGSESGKSTNPAECTQFITSPHITVNFVCCVEHKIVAMLVE